MRASDFIKEDEDNQDRGDYGNIITALNLLHNKVIRGEIASELPTPMVIRYISNTGLTGFTYQNLIAANEAEDSIKEMLKNITPETIKFTTDSQSRVDNPEEYTAAADNPEQTVSNMAKSAMKRRQD
jgi:hypothetical protein